MNCKVWEDLNEPKDDPMQQEQTQCPDSIDEWYYSEEFLNPNQFADWYTSDLSTPSIGSNDVNEC